MAMPMRMINGVHRTVDPCVLGSVSDNNLALLGLSLP